MFREHALRAAAIAAVVVVLHGCSGSRDRGEQPVGAMSGDTGFGALSLDPKSGSERDQVFHVTLDRKAGAQAPALLGLLVSPGAAGKDACYMFADPNSGAMILVNDNGEGSKELGRAPSVSNNQCELLKAGSAVQSSQSSITADFHVRFKPAFGGTKNMFVVAQDTAGNGPGLQSAGSWTVR